MDTSVDYSVVPIFGKYCERVFTEFGTTVKHWITLNEPGSVSNAGYCGAGGYNAAPGDHTQECPWSSYYSSYIQLLCHAQCYNIFGRFENDDVNMTRLIFLNFYFGHKINRKFIGFWVWFSYCGNFLNKFFYSITEKYGSKKVPINQ